MVYILILLAIAIGLAIGRKYSPKNKLHKCLTAILLPIISGIVIALFFAVLNNSPFDFWYKLGQTMAPVLFAIVAMIITLFISLKVKGSKGNDSTLIKQQVQKLHYGVGENRVDFEMELTEQEIAMMEEMRKQDPKKWMDNELELVKAARKAIADKDSLEVVSQESIENNTMEKVVQMLHYGTSDNRVDFEMELTKREIEKMEELRQREPERWLDNDLELVKAAKKELMNGDSVQEEVMQETLDTSEVRSEATNMQEEPRQEEKTVDEPVTETEVKPKQDSNGEPKDEKSTVENQTEVKLMPEKKKKSDGISKWLKVLLIVILSLGVMFGLSALASIIYTNYVFPSKAKSDDKKLIQEAKANPFKAYEIAQVLFDREENGHQSEYHDFLTDKQGICGFDHWNAGKEAASIYCQYCIDSAKKDISHSNKIVGDMLFKKGDGFCDELYYNAGVEILKYAANEGDPKAQVALGGYYGGLRYNKDEDDWYWGDYYTIDGKDIDHSKQAYWYLQAANQGNSVAMGNLGDAYMRGEGVDRNEAKGLEWIQKAANFDNAWFQRVLGDYYRDGVKMKVGSHKEIQKAVYGKAYRSEDKIREYWDDSKMEWVKYYQVEVADYKTILSIDIKQAQYWWKKAADNGDEIAKERLQHIYE